MTWQSAADFWAMGGYGLYVWGSMAAVLLGLLLELGGLLVRRRAVLALALTWHRAKQAETGGGSV
jgi:heme exporter protein D